MHLETVAIQKKVTVRKAKLSLSVRLFPP
ncbi:hypothetical protein RSC2_01411 [Bacillus paralicheniformis]|nr:hypothetical protein RSC1_03956 [Bacillus paralicheniformis]BCE09615.1 hypothetical protein RSC2_01411 [Bacillus paralicheniformis]BCE15782.1 hypothetical protein RSC3_03138 [Bacillus paralicheniformis]